METRWRGSRYHLRTVPRYWNGSQSGQIETVLPATAVEESNSLLFNGVPIEELLEGVEVISTPCASCACITCEEDTECRALRYSGEDYEAIPPELIGRAVARALEME